MSERPSDRPQRPGIVPAARRWRPAVWRGALVTAAGVASLAASWQRWINPFVDSGREMDIPARLAAGERLYRDVIFYYGPAGPWLQALALRAGGGPGRSWLPLEIVCLALTAAILVLLYRLTAAAGGPRSALAATALAAAFCAGAPRGGAFVFPYSASSLYALAGALLALDASLRPAGWRRRALVAGGIALALGARVEIGGAAALILLICAVRSRTGGGPMASPAAPGTPDAAGDEAQRTAAPPLAARPAAAGLGAQPATGVLAARPAGATLGSVIDLALGVAAGLAIYGVAFAGIPWRLLVAQGPLTHMLAMPPEWHELYGIVTGFGYPERSLPQLAWGVGLDALLLLACILPATPRPVASRAPRLPPIVPRLAFGAAAVAGAIGFSLWGPSHWWLWSRVADNLPPVFFPLPLVAGVAAVALLRRPLGERGRARFMLFALAATLAARVVLGLEAGPGMTAYCALPLAPLLGTAAVLGGDLLAPRLRDPGGFRFRLAALAVVLAGLYLVRIGALAWGPHIVRLETAAGTLRLPWKEAFAIEGTLDYLAERARPGDRLASFPEAGFFNFVTGLTNPLREEQIFPGVLGSGREAAAVARLLAARPRFILLANRPTPEFGPRAFGDDYAAGLLSAIEDHYSIAATFGNAREGAPVGARRFFIRVYEPDPAPAGR